MSEASIVGVGPCEINANPPSTRARTLLSQRDFKRTPPSITSCALGSVGRPVTYTRGPLDCSATGLRRPGEDPRYPLTPSMRRQVRVKPIFLSLSVDPNFLTKPPLSPS